MIGSDSVTHVVTDEALISWCEGGSAKCPKKESLMASLLLPDIRIL